MSVNPMNKQVKHYNVGASINDNTVVHQIWVPANREVAIYQLLSATVTKSPTANAKIELLDGGNSDAVLASVSITQTNGTQAIGISNAAGIVRIAGRGSGYFLKLQTDQATGTGCDVEVEVHMSYPGAPYA